ncbi:hypothetical protein MITSMUL_03187 [Mitsuokella multacida DSM 20544]|uniref:Uncharacterized protein n=1 Tax=Mitsuokella multacida DSM 20544 TaxID=500635 RepID=C9KJI8_9FIRM|nr:hypothetical protein MITSMUL_03187 [Mitsuokella multacida DSM 20544]
MMYFPSYPGIFLYILIILSVDDKVAKLLSTVLSLIIRSSTVSREFPHTAELSVHEN